MQSAIQLCAQAMLDLGAEPIQSFADGTAEAIVAAARYPTVRDGVLSSYPWTFATAQVDLSPLAEVPVADFDYAFQIPSDCLHVISIGDKSMDYGRGEWYRVRERRIHCNSDSVTITGIFRVDETNWPAWFDAMMVQQLSAAFCLPLTENSSRAEILTKRANAVLATARSRDAQQQTPTTIVAFPLLSARW